MRLDDRTDRVHLPKIISICLLVPLLPIVGSCVTSPDPPVVLLPATPPPTTFPTIQFPPPEPPDMAAPIALPGRPSDQKDTIVFTVAAREAPQPLFQKSGRVPRGSSMVINLPTEPRDEPESGNKFATKNHHNSYEDQVERQLMANGLNVKDRSRFEAIVRDLRDTYVGCQSRYGVVTSGRVEDICFDIGNFDIEIPGALTRLPGIQDQIPIEDYMAYMAYMEDYIEGIGHLIPRLLRIRAESGLEYRRRTGLALQFGTPRENDEIADLPDLLRAATVYPGADFILIVNELSVESGQESVVPLRQSPELRAFADAHPAVAEQLLHPSGGHLSCGAMEVLVEAKLIDVASGAIVWTGRHTATSLDDVPIEVEVTHVRAVSNYDEIVAFVESQNRGSRRIERYGQTIRVPPFEFGTTVGVRDRSPAACEYSDGGSAGADGERGDPYGAQGGSSLERRLVDRALAELIGTVPD